MNKIANALLNFITPVVVFFTGVGGILAFLLGALLNPQSWMNSVVNNIIDYVASIFPSTPDNLKLGNIVVTFINSLGSAMPAVGVGIIREVFNTLLTLIGLALIIKIYKLLPFKAT